jgi:hypothetical protein
MVIDFQRQRTRIIVAIALSIAIHEVALSLLHLPSRANNTEDVAATTKIVFEKPPPTPRPTPKPTPTPKATQPPTPPPHVTPPPHATAAPAPQIAGRAKGHPAKHRGGGAHRAIAKAKTGVYANPYAAGSGTGTSTGHGSGNAPGAGGGLNGTGSGNSGNGNGAVNANTPCGFVLFTPRDAPRYNNGTASETVIATVTYPDGHTEQERFPYPWVYPNGEANDPWSSTNLRKADEVARSGRPDPGVPAQLPPPGSDTSGYPSVIQYILAHTDSGGFTILHPCPNRG